MFSLNWFLKDLCINIHYVDDIWMYCAFFLNGPILVGLCGGIFAWLSELDRGGWAD